MPIRNARTSAEAGRPSGRGARSWAGLLAGCLLLWAAAPAGAEPYADYAEGLRAWNDGLHQKAERIWRRAGWQNDDYRAQARLGDLYGNTASPQDLDPVEAYVWYYLTTISQKQGGLGRVAERNREHIVEQAQNRRRDIFEALDTDQRHEAKSRVIYILACRGAPGLLMLGQIYDDQIEAKRRRPSFRNRGQAIDYSRIIPSVEQAKGFYLMAYQAGQPDAADHLKLHQERAARPSPDIRNRADQWLMPFERYPGKGFPGVRYTDECVIDTEADRALDRANGLKLAYAQHALGWLGFYDGKVDDQWGAETHAAVARFQKRIEAAQTGELSPDLMVQIIQTAAILGHGISQNRLGVMYAKGVGVKANNARARQWFQKAADQGHAAALYHLGVLYKKGPPGVAKDEDKGAYYIARAVQAGFGKGRSELNGRYR